MRHATKLTLMASLAAATMLGNANLAYAHHSAAPHFDTSIEIEKTGIVTEWNFVNPHAYIHFDVTNSDGSVTNWRCEHTAAAALLRLNYSKDTFVPGMKITVFGSPARREDNVCLILNMAFEDGVKIPRNSVLPDNRVAGTIFEDNTVSTEHVALRADGTPNFAGFWVAQRRARPGGGENGGMGGPPEGGGMGDAMGDAMGGPPDRGPAVELTAAGQAAENKYEQIYDDPSIKCGITNIVFGMGHDQNVNKIEQSDDKIVITYGFMDYVRTIYLDGRDFPENITPTEGGYSIGEFEGDTLIVRSKGFTPSVVHPLQGGSYSDQTQATERFTYNAQSNAIQRSYVLTDPLFFIGEYSGNDEFVKSSSPYTPYNCVELSGINNLRPGSPEYEAEVKRMEAEGISVTDVKAGINSAQDAAAEAAAKTGLPKWLLALGALVVLLGGFMALRGKKT